MLGFVRAPAATDLWCVSKNEKRDLLGPRLAGDPGAGVADGGDKLEHCFSHCILPGTFYTNLYTSYSACAVLDLTAGCGEAAKAAVLCRLPYVGLTVSELHATRLEEVLTHWTMRCIQEEGHPIV